ncbi:MAG: hypothetical protein LT082_08735 [Comamonas sp.]|nr:hypothetical protein [Comamonas sp.]
MADLTYEERKRLRRLAEDARDACNRHYGPFVDAVAHPLNILALLDMAERTETGAYKPEEPPIPLMPAVARLYTQNGYRRASVKTGPGETLVQLSAAQAAIGAWRVRANMRWNAFEGAIQQRDDLVAAMRRAQAELCLVAEHREVLPGEAASALISATEALRRGLASEI